MKKAATALLVLAALCALPLGALANNTYQTLPFSQDWTTNLLTTANDWSPVPGIVGFLGDITTGNVTGVDPTTLTADPATMFLTQTGVVFVNQTNPATFSSGGPAYFSGASVPNPTGNATIALQGSGSGDAPNLILYLDTTNKVNVRLQYDLRDIDAQTYTGILQQFTAQYRVGTSGAFTNIAGTYVANAADPVGGGTNKTTHTDVTLPVACENIPQLQVRIMTTNAISTDEEIGVDNISVTGDTPVPATRTSWGTIKNLYR
jgi:hypothetical protein